MRRRQSGSSRAQGPPNKGDPWVRRDSWKSGMLESSSDPDLSLPRPRAVRPNCLPLPLQPYSPATSSEALPSPSTSLQLSPTPMATELGGKSSSAPMLQPPPQGTLKSDDTKKRVSPFKKLFIRFNKLYGIIILVYHDSSRYYKLFRITKNLWCFVFL